MHEQRRILKKVGNKTALRVAQKVQLQLYCLQQIQVQYPLISTCTACHWDPASSDFAQDPQAPKWRRYKSRNHYSKGKETWKGFLVHFLLHVMLNADICAVGKVLGSDLTHLHSQT